MHNMSSQRTWDKIMSDYGLDEMSDEFWEDDIGNLGDIVCSLFQTKLLSSIQYLSADFKIS